MKSTLGQITGTAYGRIMNVLILDMLFRCVSYLDATAIKISLPDQLFSFFLKVPELVIFLKLKRRGTHFRIEVLELKKKSCNLKKNIVMI